MAAKQRTRFIIAGASALALAAGGATAVAAGGGASGDTDQPISGPALTRASEVALDAMGGGRVTGTEVGDEDSYYEIEVTRDDGQQVDVQLDADFRVVSSLPDVEGPEAADGD